MNANDVAQDNIKIILKDVIEIKVESETTDTQEQFLEACKFGEIEVIKEMFKDHSNLDVNEAEYGSGATGLMLASIIGHIELIEFLIDRGLNMTFT